MLEARRGQLAWLVSEPDEGRYFALNKGLARARGEVVGVLHGDDVFGDPGVLARVAALAWKNLSKVPQFLVREQRLA